MMFMFLDSHGIKHTRNISVPGFEPVSLVKAYDMADITEFVRERVLQRRGERVELLGRTSVGKIVRPEFGGQSIARGELKPLTRFDY